MQKLNLIQNQLWAHKGSSLQDNNSMRREPFPQDKSNTSVHNQSEIGDFKCVSDHVSILNNLYTKWPKDRIIHDKNAISIQDHQGSMAFQLSTLDKNQDGSVQ